VSFLPKNEWQNWSREWGLTHHPQKGMFYRNEQVVGLYQGILVQATWGGDKNLSLVVRLRFPASQNLERLKQTLVEDASLDALPGGGKNRKKMNIVTGAGKRIHIGDVPEFTLEASTLRWFRTASLNGPKAKDVPGWVALLVAALKRATPGFEGRCEQCTTGVTRQFVLLDDVPALLCGNCQQRLRAEGEMADRTYDMSEARHLNGAALAALAAVLGAAGWALFAALTERVFALAAIGIGAMVAFAYRYGAGRVDGMGRAIGGVLTLASVVLGQILYYAWALSKEHPDFGFQLEGGLAVYLGMWGEQMGTEIIVLVFGLVGAWVATKALVRPAQHPVIREADQDPREAPRRAA